MTVLYMPSEFIQEDGIYDSSPVYWYESYCPRRRERLRLPRTRLAESIAYGLMAQLAIAADYSREGKMYGLLLVETQTGQLRVLKAFSGLLNGAAVVEEWVPPIPGRDRIAIEETCTLAILDSMQRDLIALQQIPERQQYREISQTFETRLQQLTLCHHQRKQERQQQRQLMLASLSSDLLEKELEQLDHQSRQDGMERRELKRQRDTMLQPLKQRITEAEAQIHELKQQRKEVSRQLQVQMSMNYYLTNFAGESLSLQQLMPEGLPTGTGDCCAPKLLHYAATHGLKPVAIAEFWWGPPSSNGDKVQGNFYGACAERCQPLLGFLLSGLPQTKSVVGNDGIDALPILYEDEWLIAVNKPSGLRSVPGRYHDRQDSVLNRLRHGLSTGKSISAVHRLDQDTSGILLLARDQQSHRHLSQQFQQRRVHKTYEAILAGTVMQDQGVIELPLWGDPENRPYQTVDWQRGKPSRTQFRVLETSNNLTRMEFIPITGRSHQIRVHAADSRGLGVPILGDRIYGGQTTANRLHLHARELCFQHPQSGQVIQLHTTPPF